MTPPEITDITNTLTEVTAGERITDMRKAMMCWNFITATELRPLSEHLGHRDWLLSFTPETIPSYIRAIPLHDLDDIPVDLFGAQMSG